MPELRLFWITLLGTAIRVGCAYWFVDIPGDGPTRAALGYQWLMDPRFVRDGHWLPMSEVLVGLATAIVPDPRWAGRILNLVAGSASILVLGRLTGRLFGTEVGLAAALLMALLPMHVALSATSLAEPIFLFLLLLALDLGFSLQRADGPRMILLATIALTSIVTGIRYEAWLLVPALALWHLVRFRCWHCSLAFGLALSAMPLFWIMTALGGPLGLIDAFGFVAASRAAIGGEAVAAGAGIAILWARLAQTLGPALPVLAVAGSLLGWRGVTAERLVWFGLLAGAMLLAGLLAIERGQSFVDRYMLTTAVLLLPLGLLAVKEVLADRLGGWVLVLTLAGSMAAATWLDPPEQYLTRRYPPEAIEAARWLDRNRDPGASILFTRIGWQSSYVPLFHRLGRDHYRIVSWYLPDQALGAFLKRQRPAWLLTRDGDEAFVQRVTNFGWLVAPTPAAKFGAIRAHQLQPPG